MSPASAGFGVIGKKSKPGISADTGILVTANKSGVGGGAEDIQHTLFSVTTSNVRDKRRCRVSVCDPPYTTKIHCDCIRKRVFLEMERMRLESTYSYDGQSWFICSRLTSILYKIAADNETEVIVQKLGYFVFRN